MGNFRSLSESLTESDNLLGLGALLSRFATYLQTKFEANRSQLEEYREPEVMAFTKDLPITCIDSVLREHFSYKETEIDGVQHSSRKLTKKETPRISFSDSKSKRSRSSSSSDESTLLASDFQLFWGVVK